MKSPKSTNNFGHSPSGDMAKVKSASSGSAKPEQIGKAKPPEQPGHGASGEMSKVKSVADICPTGANKDR